MAKNETMRPGLMASESVQSYLVSIKFMKDEDYAEIHDGALVVIGDLIDSDAYNVGERNGVNVEGIKDYNVYKATAPAADTDDVLIVDLAEIPGGEIGGNYINYGIKLFGLRKPAGGTARARVLKKYDKFWLSDDCFVGTPEVGKYAIATANDTHHTVVDDAKTDGYCVKIEASTDFAPGRESIGTLYLCRVL